MSRKWRYMIFRNGKRTIQISYTKRVKKGVLAYIGQAKSEMFGKINLVIDHREEASKVYDLACSGCLPGDDGFSWILMDEALFYGFLQGSALARMTVFHEIGHIVFGDYLHPLQPEERKMFVLKGTVSEREIRADKSAANYLGSELVIKALEEMMIETKRKYPEEEYADDVDIVIQELALRIAELKQVCSVDKG